MLSTAPTITDVPAEKVRLRIGNLAKAVLVTGQAYQDPKDALNFPEGKRIAEPGGVALSEDGSAVAFGLRTWESTRKPTGKLEDILAVRREVSRVRGDILAAVSGAVVIVCTLMACSPPRFSLLGRGRDAPHRASSPRYP